jgi:hypothetical protein
MTQVQLTGKQINDFTNNLNEVPSYLGMKIWLPTPEYKQIRVSGSTVAQRYKDILKTIKEVKGEVNIQPYSIQVTYANGNFTIKRDILTDTFLIPLLRN